MKVLIIGLGSIAQKHIVALMAIDPLVSIYALRSGKNSTSFKNVVDIYSKADIPQDIDFVIISNPTSAHANTILEFLSFDKPMFIEKPVLMNLDDVELIKNKIIEQKITTYIACNLRFHPIIKFLKKEFEKRSPLEFSVYCGSFLPGWRTNQNYIKNYSAIKSMGGGVHLDLIHEIDYTFYLLGKPNNLVSAYLGKKSTLNIDSIDIAHYVMEYPKTSVFVTLNYYRKYPKRIIEIVWEDDIWEADLLKNRIISVKYGEIFKEDYAIQNTYFSQMKYFIDCLRENEGPMNGFLESIDVLKLALNEKKFETS